MNCREMREQIREAIESDRPVPNDGPLGRHIAGCELCRQFYSDLMLDRRLSRTLKEMPLPEPPADFAVRVVRQAVRAHRSAGGRSFFRAGLAVAAVLIVVVGITWMVNMNSAESVTRIMMPVGGEKTVRIMIEAVEPRTKATLAVALSGDVALKNFPGQDRLQWQADLRKGGNLLAIPLMLNDRAGGDVSVRYRYNGTEKEVLIKVRAENNGPAQT